MGLKGADVEGLVGYARTLDQLAGQIDRVVPELSLQAERTNWSGPDFDALQTTIREIRPLAAAAADRLRGASAEVRQNADEQQATSGAATLAGGAVAGVVGRFVGGMSFGSKGAPKPGIFDLFHGLFSGNDPGASSTYWMRSYRDVPLWADGGPSIEDVDQGGAGDCYFAASLAAMAQTDAGRKRIQDMIIDNHDGTYTVTFPGKGTYTVDADLWVGENGKPIYGGDSDGVDKLWFPIMEKAFAQMKGSYPNIDSGFGGETMAMLMDGTQHNVPTAGSSPDSIYQQMQQALAAGHPVIASTEADSPTLCYTTVTTSDGVTLYGDHQYTVTGVHESNGVKYIDLRNPHASDVANGGEYCSVRMDDYMKYFDAADYVSPRR